MNEKSASPAIRVRNVVKEYDVYARPLDVALEVLTRKSRHTTFRALDGLSFDVARGEVLGIIGTNGAGKSTLLKIITGVLEATAGEVDVDGRVTAILELGLGFNPEYSGRENIYLSGLLYGMDRAEVDSKIESIIEFSDLREFIERPVKTYSSGMHARLAFSIATAVDPDILIIDEALAAGDAGFVQKCMVRIRKLCSGGRTVLLVSHGTGLLAQLCHRVLWIEHGKARMIGPAIPIVQAYDLAAHQASDAKSWIEEVHDDLDVSPAAALAARGAGAAQDGAPADAASETTASPPVALRASSEMPAIVPGDAGRQVFRRGPVFIESVELLDKAGGLTTRLTLLEPFAIRVRYRVDGEIPRETLGVALAVNGRVDLAPVAQFMTQNVRPTETRSTYDRSPERRHAARAGALTIDFPVVPFRKGDYFLSIGLLPNAPGSWQFYEYRHFYYEFSVDDAGYDVGAPTVLDGVVSYSTQPDVAASPATGAPAAALPPPKTLREEIEQTCLTDGRYPDRWPRHRICPACGARDLRPGFSKHGFTHDRCASCGFVCVNPYPPDDVIARLYDGPYYTNMREFFEAPLLREAGKVTPYSAPQEALEAIIARAAGERETGFWLDVGGGLGAFLKLVRERKPGWRVRLNELNDVSVAFARDELGLDVVAADIDALRASGERYDVISAICVVEHTPDPLAFLRSYVDLLAPGGLLIAAVPQFTQLNAAVSRGSSPNCAPPFHLSLFNMDSFDAMLRRLEGVALEVVEQAGPPAFSLLHLVPDGERWDTTIPSSRDPAPQSFRTQHPTLDQAVALNALSEIEPRVADYFAQYDGRSTLIGFCRRTDRVA